MILICIYCILDSIITVSIVPGKMQLTQHLRFKYLHMARLKGNLLWPERNAKTHPCNVLLLSYTKVKPLIEISFWQLGIRQRRRYFILAGGTPTREEVRFTFSLKLRFFMCIVMGADTPDNYRDQIPSLRQARGVSGHCIDRKCNLTAGLAPLNLPVGRQGFAKASRQASNRR